MFHFFNLHSRRNSSASGPTYHMHAGRQVLLSGSETDLEQENVLDNNDSEVCDGEVQ